VTKSIFIDGAAGTTGLEIADRLAGRPEFTLITLDDDKRKDPAAKREALNDADFVILCLPDDAAREAAALVSNPHTCLIDASTAHRTLPDWVFGLPELAPGQRERIRQSKRIANPGCHASAFILLLRPLVDAALVSPTLPVSATSITGYSGGGKKMIEQYQAAQSSGAEPALTSPRPYALSLTHKHLPEMMAHTGLAVPPLLMPVVSNFYKGLSVSVPLHLSQLPPRASAEAIHAAFASRYEGERFIRVLPLSDPDTLQRDGGYFDVMASNDSNRVDIFVFANDSQAILIARLDNLGKGASGAAVQTMNVHLGVDEGLGL